MNRIYKTIWNKAKCCLSVVSELANNTSRSRGTINVRLEPVKQQSTLFMTGVAIAVGLAFAAPSASAATYYGSNGVLTVDKNGKITAGLQSGRTVADKDSLVGAAASASSKPAVTTVRVSGTGKAVLKVVTGGIAQKGAVSKQNVIVSGGTMVALTGGNSLTGLVSANTVTKKGGIVTGAVSGGATSSSKVANNVVVISGSGKNVTVNGGSSKTGIASGNRVAVYGSTTSKNIAGGQTTSGTVSGNIVKFKGGTVSGVIRGGKSSTGVVSGNSISVLGGTIVRAYGGESKASVINNKVTKTGGIVKTALRGGSSTGGKVADNVVVISGSGKNVTVNGGFSQTGIVSGNRVAVYGSTISKNITGGQTTSSTVSGNIVKFKGGTVNGIVRGGWSSTGTISSNKVSVLGGTIAKVYGGHGTSSAVTGNTVTKTGGTINEALRGGYSTSGKVSNNQVTISGSGGNGNVLGGYSDKGVVSGNKVTVSGSTTSKDIAGGQTGSGTVSGNAVTFNGGTVSGVVRGGFSSTGAVSSNSVTVSGGTIAKVHGGDSSNSGAVSGNTVTIKGGTVTGLIRGGYSSSGVASNNSVVISGGTTSTVIGGESAGNVTSNIVTINGGKINGTVYAGKTSNGSATGNIVNLSNANVSGIVYSGHAGGSAVIGGNNTIKAKGANTVGGMNGYDTLELTVGQVNAGDTGKPVITVTGSSGADLNSKTVNVQDTGDLSSATNVSLLKATAGKIKLTGATLNKKGTFSETSWKFNAETGEVTDLSLSKGAVLTMSAAPKRMMMRLAAAPTTATSADTEGAVQETSGTTGADTTQGVGETVTSTTNTPAADSAASVSTSVQQQTKTDASASDSVGKTQATADTKTADAKDTGTAKQQAKVTDSKAKTAKQEQPSALAAAEDQETETVQEIVIQGETKVTENSKTLSEALLGTVALVNQGTEFIADQGMAAIDEASANGTSVFGAIHGGASRYETGSHIDLDSVSLMAGVAAKPTANTTLAGFIEAGWGNSKSHVSGAKGSGEHDYYGIGIAGKYRFDNPFYVDGSIRLGVAKTNFDGRYAGDKAHYKNEAFYTAAHIGGGYVFNLGEKTDLDLYGRYAVTWLDGDDVRLHDRENSKFHMGSSTTHALRGGFRFTGEATDTIKWKAGLAYEHIFNGDAKGNINGASLDTPTLQGNTGIGEVGIIMKPSANSAWTFDLTAKGYVGDRRGGAGSITAKYAF